MYKLNKLNVQIAYWLFEHFLILTFDTLITYTCCALAGSSVDEVAYILD